MSVLKRDYSLLIYNLNLLGLADRDYNLLQL